MFCVYKKKENIKNKYKNVMYLNQDVIIKCKNVKLKKIKLCVMGK